MHDYYIERPDAEEQAEYDSITDYVKREYYLDGLDESKLEQSRERRASLCDIPMTAMGHEPDNNAQDTSEELPQLKENEIMNDNNPLATLNSARLANKLPKTPDFQEAMQNIKQYSNQLSGLETSDLQELDELLDKIDSLSGIFEKYAKLQDKIESLQANAAIIENSLADLTDLAETAKIDPFVGYTEDQTYSISVQLIKEFEGDTRLAKDLLELSKAQVLDEDIPEEVPAFEGLTQEQTVRVYMQVMDEFEGNTELSKRLAYNAGV